MVWYFSDGSLITLCTSSFVDDIIFSHNGVNGPESNMTRMLHPIRLVAHQLDIKQCCLVEFARWRHPGQSLPSLTASCCEFPSELIIV